MPDPTPTTAARLAALQDALLRTAISAPAGGNLRSALTSAAQWALWAGCHPLPPINRSTIAAALAETNRLIAEPASPSSLSALRNLRSILSDLLDQLEHANEPANESDEAA